MSEEYDYIERAEIQRETVDGLRYEEYHAERQRGEYADEETPDPIRLATYTLRIMGPEGWPGFPDAARGLGAALSEAEENLNDLLPEGYYTVIEEAD